MGYSITKNIDKGYFNLNKNKKSNHTVDYLLNKFNIDLDDYWIMKKSSNQRLVNIEDIEKWSGVICFRKDTFNKEDIDKWLNFLYKDLSMKYLNKPFPPIEIFNKIKIIDGI